MNREEFLSKFGISLAAVCAGGCLAACGKGDSATPITPSTPPVNPPPSGVNFTLDLNTDIKNVGESKVNSGVIVVRIATGNATSSFSAVQVACTHEGTSIAYSTNQGKFVCPNHGSQFSNAGTVLLGPATANLKAYTLALSGTTLTVTS